MSLDQVRAVADAVLYEGYLLYPYRASSHKNRSRWQFGVLGPPRASAASFGEEPDMETQCLLAPRAPGAAVTVRLRFLQLQVREVQRREEDGSHTPVPSLDVDGVRELSWDEAVEREITLPATGLGGPTDTLRQVAGGEETEPLTDARGSVPGRIVRRRLPLTVRIRTHTVADGGHLRLSVSVRNEHPDPADDKNAAIRASLIGAHLILEARDATFVSLLEPPAEAAEAAGRCHQRRCWPVLAGAKGSTDTVLGAPIILYDHPEVAEQSAGALFDSTEIDEILTLRVMTMTEKEKAEARATDPRAREIIDRCDGMSPADMQRLHGLMRDPHAERTAGEAGAAAFDTAGAPWWDPASDADVPPGSDTVVIGGVGVTKGSLVTLRPSRRADAQDLFFAGQVARVTAVLSDVDGGTHVAVVLVDDPAADMHDWYGRYLYFAPDEVEPLPATSPEHREESRS
ncbi:hypothetical protein OG909_30425 [Streptomyces sp. NBC_01754]|uniref:hypothetical protein n=1 Tax=Streptomyces sp. NBC_01754 TaxID=2975930 RepID=UPI002DDB7110|nr:hypothetical protein [Streptomyces sp. NBC_01754]WSC96270.1 hypothetical protein OG909_30425 [Streptomyces sp. NBC_01754]